MCSVFSNIEDKVERMNKLSGVLESDSMCPIVYSRFLEYIQVYEEARQEVENLKRIVKDMETKVEAGWSANGK